MRNKLSFTALLGIGIFLAGISLAILSPEPLKMLAYGWGALAVWGGWILFFSPLTKLKLIASPLGEESISVPLFPLKLFAWQFLLLSVTFICFQIILAQSQLITRLQPLTSGQLFGLLQKHNGILGFLPWMLYGVVGVGLAYFSFCKNTVPLMHHIIVPCPTKPLQYFFHSLNSIIHEMSITVPFLFLVCAAILLLGEGFCKALGWDSPLYFSARTAIVWFLIVLFYKTKHARLAEWMQAKHLSMGVRLMIYVLGLSILLLAYQGFWVLIPIVTDNPVNMAPLEAKGVLVGMFSETELYTRLYLLIIGWWSIWIPWMTSVIARYSYGYAIWRAFLNALIVPILFFVAYVQIGEMGQELFTFYRETASVQIFSALMCIGFVVLSLKSVHHFSDLTRGALLPIRKSPKHALKKVMSTFLVRLIPYLYGSYVLGWFSTQVIATLSSIFLFVLILSFIWVLTSASQNQRLVKKEGSLMVEFN